MNPMPKPITACDGSVKPADPTTATSVRMFSLLTSLQQAQHDNQRAVIQNFRV